MSNSSTNLLLDLTGRRALITGSTQGIGLALAYGLARSGASIVLNGREPQRRGREGARAALDPEPRSR